LSKDTEMPAVSSHPFMPISSHVMTGAKELLHQYLAFNR